MPGTAFAVFTAVLLLCCALCLYRIGRGPTAPDRPAWELPLVTVITPSLNQGEFIEECLASVRNQSHPRIEHLVIDGGSTDRTLEVLGNESARGNLRWWSEPDRGQAKQARRQA